MAPHSTKMTWGISWLPHNNAPLSVSFSDLQATAHEPHFLSACAATYPSPLLVADLLCPGGARQGWCVNAWAEEKEAKVSAWLRGGKAGHQPCPGQQLQLYP